MENTQLFYFDTPRGNRHKLKWTYWPVLNIKYQCSLGNFLIS